MENLSILARINSNYILKDIFTFIRSKNFKLKLFVYSKYFQKKLDLKLINYQEHYLDQFGMKFMDYLFFNLNGFVGKDFNKNSLKQKLDDDISKNNLSMNKIESIIIDYFKDMEENTKIDLVNLSEIPIDIYSPFFNCISKTKYFETIFTILIFVDIIEKYNLKKDYIDFFNKLNESDCNYSSLKFKYKNNEDINYLEDFNVNFDKIKRLSINREYNYTDSLNNNYFLEKLLSFNLSNLVCLDIDVFDSDNEIELNSIKNLNNLKSLKVLCLSFFNFKDNFLLKIKDLYKLKLNYCNNISFDEDIFLNTKLISLDNCNIIQQKWINKIPNVENFSIILKKDMNLEQIFDLSNIQNLKDIEIFKEKFISIECLKLEKVGLYSLKENDSIECEKKVLQKLISLKNLKEFSINLDNISDNDISTINDENYSVTRMDVYWLNNNEDCILYNLQNKFKNLTKLVLNQNIYSIKNKILEIKENKNCKVNKITLNQISGNNIKLYCQSYENLIKLKIDLENNIDNLENTIPIFNKDCKIKFKSLTTFKFKMVEDEHLNRNILDNIYKNLDSMPNLKKLLLDFIVPELDEEYFKKFIKKILLLKLKNVHINIQKYFTNKKEYYLENDYKELFPDIIFDYEYDEIYIQKFNKERKNEHKYKFREIMRTYSK